MSPKLQIGFLVMAGITGLIALALACVYGPMRFDGQILMMALVIISITAWRVSLVKPELFE